MKRVSLILIAIIAFALTACGGNGNSSSGSGGGGNPPPQVSISPASGEFGVGETFSLSVDASDEDGIGGYTWRVGSEVKIVAGGGTDAITISGTYAGETTVSVTVADNHGATTTATATINVVNGRVVVGSCDTGKHRVVMDEAFRVGTCVVLTNRDDTDRTLKSLSFDSEGVLGGVNARLVQSGTVVAGPHAVSGGVSFAHSVTIPKGEQVKFKVELRLPLQPDFGDAISLKKRLNLAASGVAVADSTATVAGKSTGRYLFKEAGTFYTTQESGESSADIFRFRLRDKNREQITTDVIFAPERNYTVSPSRGKIAILRVNDLLGVVEHDIASGDESAVPLLDGCTPVEGMEYVPASAVSVRTLVYSSACNTGETDEHGSPVENHDLILAAVDGSMTVNLTRDSLADKSPAIVSDNRLVWVRCEDDAEHSGDDVSCWVASATVDFGSGQLTSSMQQITDAWQEEDGLLTEAAPRLFVYQGAVYFYARLNGEPGVYRLSLSSGEVKKIIPDPEDRGISLIGGGHGRLVFSILGVFSPQKLYVWENGVSRLLPITCEAKTVSGHCSAMALTQQ